MSQTNTKAPPAEAPKGDFIKFDPFPKNDTVVLTVVDHNYIAEHTFERTRDNGEKYSEVRPAVELYFGAIVDGKPYFVKPWPQVYSLADKANYAKWYKAAVGVSPIAGTTPDDMTGKTVLGTIGVEHKVGKKGTKYAISKLVGVTTVPSILLATATPLEKLKPALTAILAGDEANDEDVPF